MPIASMFWIDQFPLLMAGLGVLCLVGGLLFRKIVPLDTPPAVGPPTFSERMSLHRAKRSQAQRRLDDELRQRVRGELEEEEQAREALDLAKSAQVDAAELEADQDRLKNFDVFRSLVAAAQASPDAEVEVAPSADLAELASGPLSRLLVHLSQDLTQDPSGPLDELKEVILLTEDLCDLLEQAQGEVAWRPELRRAWEQRLQTLAKLESALFADLPAGQGPADADPA